MFSNSCLRIYSALSAAEALAVCHPGRPDLNRRGQVLLTYLRKRLHRETARAA